MNMIFLAGTLAMAATLGGAAPRPSLIDTPSGRYEGRLDDGVRVFRGIPYAKPPVGELRWRPPVPIGKHADLRQAIDFGPSCFQAPTKLSTVYDAAKPLPTSEDCLTLNVWAPKNAHGAPVMVWIHGGALVNGSSSEPMYDGRRYAERGIVFVSINYRLGVFGWFAHPALSAESPTGISGNYGLMDQVASLEWVKRNIGAFGGDPANVTIAGESAGALSVMYLMISPKARGLFSKAIAQSAYMISMPALKSASHGAPAAEDVGLAVQKGFGAADIKALRAIAPDVLADKAPALGFAPWGVVDGQWLPEQMVDSFDRRHQAKVPILAGFNQGEIRSLMMLAPKDPPSGEAYVAEIRKRYGPLADDFLAVYPPSSLHESIIAATRDSLYGWTAVRLARRQTAVGKDAFLYLFDHGYPAMDEAGLHAFHASELPFTFGTFGKVGPKWPKVPDTAEQRRFSEAMIDYWASFVRDGRPGAKAEPRWTPYGAEGHYMHFAQTPAMAQDLFPGMYRLHERVMCRRRATGGIGWNWNVGIASPPLPPETTECVDR